MSIFTPGKGKYNAKSSNLSSDGALKLSKSNAKVNTDQYFSDVYDQTFKKMSKYVVSKCGSVLDAEDILQNVYARFYQRIQKKGSDDIGSAEAFLVQIAKFEIKTYFSGRKKHSTVDNFADFTEEQMTMVEAEMSKEQDNLEDVLCNQMLARQILQDIANSDEVTGKIFYMYFVLNMKLDDVAVELGINLSTVKNKLYRTIEKQKKKFGI